MGQHDDTVDVLPSTAAALDALGMCSVDTTNLPEKMAWLFQVLKHIPDDPAVFPHGKWATIQSIEMQVEACAKKIAKKRLADVQAKDGGVG